MRGRAGAFPTTAEPVLNMLRGTPALFALNQSRHGLTVGTS
jgi:hypothetical protein